MNPQPKLYHFIDIEGEKKLRQVNPFQAPSIYACRTDEEIENYNQFEQSAIANAKMLLNPVPGKVEYSSDELREVYRRESYITASEKCMIVCDYGDYLIAREDTYNNLRTDIAFEYIGENNCSKCGFDFESADHAQNCTGVKPSSQISINAASYENGKQAERSRIIGLIESEKLAIEKCLENMNRSNEFRNSCHTELSVLNKLLTLIKQDGK